jgi:hypothetical protein
MDFRELVAARPWIEAQHLRPASAAYIQNHFVAHAYIIDIRTPCRIIDIAANTPRCTGSLLAATIVILKELSMHVGAG